MAGCRAATGLPVEAAVAISCLPRPPPQPPCFPPPHHSPNLPLLWPNRPMPHTQSSWATTRTQGASPGPPANPGRVTATPADLGQARQGQLRVSSGFRACVHVVRRAQSGWKQRGQPSRGLNEGPAPGAGGPLRPIRSASPDTKHPNQAAAPRSHILCHHKLSPWGPSQKRQLPNAIVFIPPPTKFSTGGVAGSQLGLQAPPPLDLGSLVSGGGKHERICVYVVYVCVLALVFKKSNTEEGLRPESTACRSAPKTPTKPTTAMVQCRQTIGRGKPLEVGSVFCCP